MSDALKISSENVKDWLQRETNPVMLPVREKAKELLDQMRETLEAVTESSEMLLENSKEEAEKRSKKTFGRARALDKLARIFIKRMKQIKIPETISYDGLHDFLQETQKAFVVTDVDIRNWFPRISPYFILDRRKFQGVFEKAKESFRELQKFLTKEYIKTKNLEETYKAVDNLLTLESELMDLEAKRAETEVTKLSIESEISGIKREINDLESHKCLTQLDQMSIDIKRLKQEVKHKLRHLRKPFLKFQRLVIYKGGLTPEESKFLSRYVESPFDAFASEETGYPCLKKILLEIDNLISSGKLKLKSSRKRKARQDIQSMLYKNSLDTLYQKCRDVIACNKQLLDSTESMEIRRNLQELQKSLRRLNRRKKRIETKENMIERNSSEILMKINNQKKEIEKNVLDQVETAIQIS